MDLVFLGKAVTWLLVSLKCVITLAVDIGHEDGRIKHTTFDRASTAIRCSDQILTNREGVITSPEYPSYYPNHLSCTWHIRANMGEVVTLIFQDLDIEETGVCPKGPCCTFNWVKIGPSLNGSEAEYCGHGDQLPTFVSSIPKVWIKFHISRVQQGGRGFKLLYTIGPRRGHLCDTNQIRCDEGKCLPQSARCSGIQDCKDGSDENLCPEICPIGQSCRSGYLCYDNQQRCDGVSDCPDYSDELGCGICSANETSCGGESSQCYNPLTQRCNRIMDCMNGEDEKDCLRACPGKIVCLSGSGCYASEERCDGVAQCSDSSDEKNCGSDLCKYERGGFLCGNGRCIQEIWKCDHTNDCGDGTDEYNCLRNSVLTAAVMGSLICALLLVIAISCTCRLYSLRALETRMSNRETMLSRMNQEFLFREPPPSYAAAVGEHCRSLCFENVHYNTCPRRSRRRTRRARRIHEQRRPSVSTLEGGRRPVISQQPFNLLFPSLGNPNPLNMQTTHSISPLPNILDNAEGRNSGQVEQNSDHKLPEHRKSQKQNSVSTDAESSFSELSFSPKTEDSTSTSSEHVTNINPVLGNQFQNISAPASDNALTFQSEHFAHVELSTSAGSCSTNRAHCDTDTEPLIP